MAGTRKSNTSRTERDWTILPLNVVYMIAMLVLGDVVDFFSFRATCHDWRSYTQQFMQDPSAPCFHPRRWIMLSNGDGSPTELRLFLNTSTGRLLRVKVPELRKQHRFLTTADGLLIIGHDSATIVLNLLTRFCIRYPPLSFDQDIQVRVTGAAITSACTVILCIELYNKPGLLYVGGTVKYAKRNSRYWTTLKNGKFLADDLRFRNSLQFQDTLYTVDGTGMIKGLNLNTQPMVTTIIPPTFGPNSLAFFLVECRGQMLLVRKISTDGSDSGHFKVFIVDLTLKSLIPISSIDGQSFFISDERTLSISAGCLPSVEANSIYFVRHVKLIHSTYRMGCVYNLSGGSALNLHLFSMLHQLNHWRQPSDLPHEQRILIRPYSLVDNILCYCYQQAWCKGVMFLGLYKKKIV